jgi:hypothetical protein
MQQVGIRSSPAQATPRESILCGGRFVCSGRTGSPFSSHHDHGRPWASNSHIPCLIVFNGELYCGIVDADKPEDKAKVFRYAGGKEWVDCGRLGNDPDHHSVQSMIVHDGKLYAGTGIWNWLQARGDIKGLPRAAPTHVFVYEGGKTWRDLGQVGRGTRVGSMASFAGELYAAVDPRGSGHVHRYDGKQWIDCGAPDAGNPGCILPYGGKLYVSTRDSVYEYEGGQAWRCIGAGAARRNANPLHAGGWRENASGDMAARVRAALCLRQRLDDCRTARPAGRVAAVQRGERLDGV